MRREARAKVLLEQSRQRGLEPARPPMDEHAEIHRAENAPPDRSQGRHRHPVGSEVEHRQTRANRAPQLRTSRRCRQNKRCQSCGQRGLDPGDHATCSKRSTAMQEGPAPLELLGQDAEHGAPMAPRLGAIRPEIERLDRTVDALMRFMRPQELKFTPTSLGDLLRVVANQTVRQGIKVEYKLDGNLGSLNVDRALLAEAWRNVISNAAEAARRRERHAVNAARQRTDSRKSR